MSSVCISNCVRDAAGDPRIPVRATYVNLYKWPESDAEFVRSMSFRGGASGTAGAGTARHGHPRVVDSISCRQMYLRSYPFSKEEDHVQDRTRCFGRFGREARKGKGRGGRDRDRKCIELKRVKDVSWKALYRIFNRLLSCSASVDVAAHSKNF